MWTNCQKAGILTTNLLPNVKKIEAEKAQIQKYKQSEDGQKKQRKYRQLEHEQEKQQKYHQPKVPACMRLC